MADTFKLDDLVTAAHAEYDHYPVELSDGEVVVLRNALRLSEDERNELGSKGGDGENDEDSDESTLEGLRKFVRLVADDKDAAERLLSAIGDDLAVLVHIVKGYNKATQAGEA